MIIKIKLKLNDCIQLPNHRNENMHVITSIISFLWFGNWIQSLSFSSILIIISIFTYVLYEIVWNKLSKKNEKN